MITLLKSNGTIHSRSFFVIVPRYMRHGSQSLSAPDTSLPRHNTLFLARPSSLLLHGGSAAKTATPSARYVSNISFINFCFLMGIYFTVTQLTSPLRCSLHCYYIARTKVYFSFTLGYTSSVSYSTLLQHRGMRCHHPAFFFSTAAEHFLYHSCSIFGFLISQLC